MGFNPWFVAPLLVVSIYAWWRGGAPERLGAAIFAGGSALTHVALAAPPLRFRSVEVGVLLVDVAAFLAFLWLAARANRFWPLWVSGLLGVALVGHVAMKVDPHILPYAYRFALTAWSYPILLLIAIGTWQHRKRLNRYGADSSWSRFSSRDGRVRRGPPPAG